MAKFRQIWSHCCPPKWQAVVFIKCQNKTETFNEKPNLFYNWANTSKPSSPTKELYTHKQLANESKAIQLNTKSV